MTVSRVAFIDSRVADYQLIVAALPDGTDWFLINADEDGLSQMARSLSGYADLVAIDVIALGSEAAVTLGSGRITETKLDERAVELGQIGASLTYGGAVLLYGSEVVAGNDGGWRFINKFSLLTGTKVLASSNISGAGGDWWLEGWAGDVTRGDLDLYLAFPSYPHSLDAATAGSDIFVGAEGNDTFVGGAGIDAVIYGGTSAGYVFGLTSLGEITVTDTSQPDGLTHGVDTLRDIENLQFLDARVAVRNYATTHVNTTIAYDQRMPDVAGLAGGGYVVTWASDQQDGSGLGVFSQRYDQSGIPIGPESLVNTTTLYNQVSPAVAPLNDGGYAVVWSAWSELGVNVFVQRYYADGSRAGSETRVNDVTTGPDYVESYVAGLLDGGYVAVWSAWDRANGATIYFQRYDASGLSVGLATRVNSTDAYSGYYGITPTPDGGFVIVWNGPDVSWIGVYAQRFSADGSPAGPEVRINTTTAGNQVNPAVTAVSDEGYVVTWTGRDTDGRWDVYIQRFAPDGTARGSETRVNETKSYGQADPVVTAVTGGGFVVMWQEAGADGTYDLYRRLFALEGVPIGTPTRFETSAWSVSGGEIAPLTDGGYITVWETVGSPNEPNPGVYSQRFDSYGSAVQLTGDSSPNTIVWFDDSTAVLEGNGGADSLRGGANADTLLGGPDNDSLEGGAGADTLNGGTGDDTYIVDDAGDVTSEVAGEGKDRVESSINWTLAANVEQLVLLGTTALTGTGNTTANAITGNSADNSLLGLSGKDTLLGGAGADTLNGGTGADSMAGGAGDDVYLLDAVGDVITEFSGEGTDVIRSALTRTLPVNVEQLVLTGSRNVNGTGNADANVITGNTGNNSLSGGAGSDTLLGGQGNDALNGGAGADSMIGGAGDDSYTVSQGDKIVEVAGGGTDTVNSVIAWTLTGNIENLLLTGAAGVAGTGNALANVLRGNDGGNRLLGQDGADTLAGGLGNDTLTGGAGADVFLFDTALNVSGNRDSVIGFVSGADKIQLDDDIFSSLTGGVALTSAQFLSGAGVISALTSDHRVIYNTTTGALYYDADGLNVMTQQILHRSCC